MSLKQLREEVFEANIKLVDSGLVVLTWGNASGIDRDRGVMVIKPSGVDYATMTPANMVAVDMDGKVLEGNLRPSSDTATHIALYKAWPEIGGVAHTHSPYGTAFAQAGKSIPCYGTTHADFCPGDIPCVRPLTREEVASDYEAETGNSVVQHYARYKINPLEYPGTVLHHHGPITWGKTSIAAVDNAFILENIARMAMFTKEINPAAAVVPEYIIQKHYLRKHGPNAYYGQK